MDSLLASALRIAVYDWLNRLDMLVAETDHPTFRTLAQGELVRLTAAWRALLAEHEADEEGRCPQCSGWRRRKKFPCSGWLSAHNQLVASEVPPCAGKAPRHAVASNWAGA
jgi:hypothetical protein